MPLLNALAEVCKHEFKFETALYFLGTICTLVVGFWLVKSQNDDLPELNPQRSFEFTNRRRIAEFVANSKSLFEKGRMQFGNKPYKLMSDWGPVIVLPLECIDELKSDPRMNFLIPASDDGHGYIPGFEPFNGDTSVAIVVSKYLTTNLNWHEITPSKDLSRLVARMSTRIFMGEDLCTDQSWIEASAKYTALVFAVGDKLRIYPRSLRPIVHWFMPSCWEVRRARDNCRQVLKPHVDRRIALKAQFEAQGQSHTFDDSIEWFEKEGAASRDTALKQITLSISAIHTTTDLLVRTMTDIARNSELFNALRKEILEVLSSEGLKDASLYKLKLLDSVLKESQRLKPVLLSSFRRQATEDVQLKNGYVVKKGTRVVIDNTHMWDSNYYNDPTTYDGYRFFNKRQTPGEDKHTQLASISARHMGFGLGQHACPGRFFAANEIKIALCHLLLKYDWRLPDGFSPQPLNYGMNYLTDPEMRILIRRREEELKMEILEG